MPFIYEKNNFLTVTPPDISASNGGVAYVRSRQRAKSVYDATFERNHVMTTVFLYITERHGVRAMPLTLPRMLRLECPVTLPTAGWLLDHAARCHCSCCISCHLPARSQMWLESHGHKRRLYSCVKAYMT